LCGTSGASVGALVAATVYTRPKDACARASRSTPLTGATLKQQSILRILLVTSVRSDAVQEKTDSSAAATADRE